MPEIFVLFAFWRVNTKYSSFAAPLIFRCTIDSGPVFIRYIEIWFGGLAGAQRYTAVLLDRLFVCYCCYFCSFNLSAWCSLTDFSFILLKTKKKKKKKNQNPGCSPDCFNRYIRLEFDFAAMLTGTW